MTRGMWRGLLGLLLAVTVAACAPATKKAILKTFFDGVDPPPPVVLPGAAQPFAVDPLPAGGSVAASAPILPVASHDAAAAGPGDVGLPAAEPPRPALEETHDYEQVLAALPRDVVGGVDWVKAIVDGTINPRSALPTTPTPTAPFTLDGLVPALGSGTTPALDLTIDIHPAAAPFYKVAFPHSSHTLWLNCTSCHPGIAGKRPGMQAIFKGEYCGTCHGKVSFSPETGCGRCHAAIRPAVAEVVKADLAKARGEPVAATPELIARGAQLYKDACAVCHGDTGDGKGPLAEALALKPRDLVKGTYRFRSTTTGMLPTDWDLFRTITNGVPQSRMPPFSGFTYEDRFALVHYIKTLSPRFAADKPGEPVVIPPAPTITPEMIAKGKEAFAGVCVGCHGAEGDGNGAAAPALRDEGGDLVRPFDFTSGRAAKSGGTPEDIYRVLVTGIDGTPMGAFGAGMPPEQAWSLVGFLWSLGEANRGRPQVVKGDIHFSRVARLAPPAAAPPAPATAGTATHSAESVTGLAAVAEPAVSHDTVAAPVLSSPPLSEDLPAATFPHWFHRVRFRCSVCHPAVFEMKAGANPITMDGMRAGKFCAVCHSGKIAWPVGFQVCIRCHVS